MSTIRVGIVGLGANTKLRHVPGLRACDDVELTAVCNRSSASTRAAAREFEIPHVFDHWRELVASDDVDAVVIGTWPCLHCEITLAALAAGKHVLTEARMARTVDEARRMLAASQQQPRLVAQIVPSPFGLRADRLVKELVRSGYLGDLREVVVIATSDTYADASLPLHWRQSAELSGVNMLTLGILHETLIRWVPDPISVLAKTQTYTTERVETESGAPRPVETPDAVHVLTQLPGGARGLYHFQGAIHFGPPAQIHLYGSEGTLRYQFTPQDRLFGARRGEREIREIHVPPDKEGGWRVEAEFIDAIRGRGKIEFTDFATGVRYMEFTEAVAHSAAEHREIKIPVAWDSHPEPRR